MASRLEKLNKPYQIERIIRDWIACDKEIINIDISEDGQMITIIYQQNKTEKGFLKMEVGII